MNNKSFTKKPVFYWILAILIAASAMIYQRGTGPTYPLKAKATIQGKEYHFKFLRSHGGEEDCPIEIEIDNENVTGSLYFKRFKSKDDWTELKLTRKGNVLSASLPWQPPAGKLAYYIRLSNEKEQIFIQKEEPVVIRFKGAVPTGILIPHVLFMILTIIFSAAALVFALADHPHYVRYGYTAILTLIIGGLILGPIVQKYAFNEYWAGIPYGYDLTDNKTLFLFIAWMIAVLIHWKRKNRWIFVAAAVAALIIYAIPHSAMGSELNYETGTVEQADL